MKRFFFLWLAMIFPAVLYGQYIFLGDAKPMGGGCIQLTPDYPYREGIAWASNKVDLDEFFEIQFDIYLGDKDDLGADGIAFVIHNDVREFEAFGTYGECLGYGRWNVNYLSGAYIAPSVAVEFDTYHNPNQNDPFSDHAAYLENGTTFHDQFWNNGDDNLNLEDGALHDFRFRWEPGKKKVTVSLDGTIVYEGERDLVKDVFQDNPMVIWGFTASTGRKFNLQYFCLKRLALLTE